MTPHIVLKRCDIEIAEQDRAFLALHMHVHAFAHLVQE